MTDASPITGLATSAGALQAEAYVTALGSWSCGCSNRSASDPVSLVKGYSTTVPITDLKAAPVSTMMDESYKAAIMRRGDRIRVGGTAEISGYSTQRRGNTTTPT